MRAFIVRPFGTKQGIDFDRVEAELVRPALSALRIDGGTTAELLCQGNIRADMFDQLLKADLVIADLSIHNANVFYELGVRHALRDRRTFLIRCSGDEVPFDLRTDRYLSYKKDAPADSVDQLTQSLRATLSETRQDSPVFQLIPDLRPQDWLKLVVVPRGFTEEVERAERGNHIGDLELLAEEARAFAWAPGGLKEVGRAQFELNAMEGAKSTWEVVRELTDEDFESDCTLGTVYQRMGDLTRSDQAVRRARAAPHTPSYHRAELCALMGSNAKTRWRQEWQGLDEDRRQAAALVAPSLTDAYRHYSRGFSEDLRHYYAGVNALGLLTVITELAAAVPEAWSDRFESDSEAQRVLAEYRQRREALVSAVTFSLATAHARMKTDGTFDIWARLTSADLSLLTSGRPGRVAAEYRNALAAGSRFHFDAVRRQLELYRDLGVRSANVNAALDVLNERESHAAPAPSAEGGAEKVLLFTGHMIDKPERQPPRFPLEKAESARAAIRQAVRGELEGGPQPVIGIAGGACGGDLLFHEVCDELGVPTRLFLAIPPEQYITTSVQHAGPGWVERFHALRDRLPTRVLAESKELPRWLQQKSNYSIWRRCNLWILHNALSHGGPKVTLIALWDGDSGDGPGGTSDMVSQARRRGAKLIVVDTKSL